MSGFSVLVRKELREQWRTMRLLVVGGLYLAFGVMSPLIARYTPEIVKSFGGKQFANVTVAAPTLADAVGQFVKNVGGTAALAAILLAMAAVAAEKERGTAAYVMVRPAGRAAFIAAKATALATTLFVGMVAASLGGYAYTAMLFSPPSLAGWIAMCLLLWLGQVVLASVTLLGSTVTKSTAVAGGIGFIAYVLLSLLGSMPVVGRLTPQALNEPAMSMALGQAAGDVVVPLAATLALALAASGAAWLSFRRQEL